MHCSNKYPTKIPEKRIALNPITGEWGEPSIKQKFLKGPVPLDWLNAAAQLPGKAINVGLALWWLHGMSKTGELKVTRQALVAFSISRDALYDGLNRLQEAGLVELTRKPGQRHLVRIIKNPALHRSND